MHVQSTPEGFIQDFTVRRLWTARLVRLFKDEDLKLSPGPGSPSTAEQINQICQTASFIKSVMTDEVPDMKAYQNQFDMSSMQTVMQALRNTMEEVKQAAKKVTPEFWAEEIEPFGPEWRMSRGAICYLNMEHETHHRGQLTVYLRVAGKTPPMLYETVDEKVFDLNG